MARKRKTDQPPTADEVIRAALAARLADGDSINRIAKEAGYAGHSQLARYMRGERALTVGPKLDGLLRVLGLLVVKE